MKQITVLLLSLFCVVDFSSAASYENMYVTGNATTVGWSTGGTLPMTKASAGVFTWTGILKSKDGSDNTGAFRFKFLPQNGWNPSITCRVNVPGHLVLNSGEEADIYVFTGDGNDNSFQVKETAIYDVQVNLNTMKMKCTKLSDVADPDSEFSKETLKTSSSEVLNYRKLTPKTIEQGVKYPLVIVLHGAGERGSDNTSQLKYGGDLFVKAENRNAYPAYVLFPQCPSNYFWPFASQPASYNATTFPVDYTISPAIQQVKELIDTYLKMDNIDKDRVYITGLSMGGMGTFDIVCRFPDIFAAAVPICGGINVERLNTHVKNVSWRIFHGDADGVVPVKNSRDAKAKLTTIGASVEYIEFPGVDHFAWTDAFKREDFLPWIFAKTRGSSSDIKTVEEMKNPTISFQNNKLYVETEDTGTFQINLYSISGILLQTFTGNSSQKEYDLSSFEKGIYIIKIESDNVSVSRKIIIK